MDTQKTDSKSIKPDRVKLVEATVAYRRWFVDVRNKSNPSFTKAYENFDILYEQISVLITKAESRSINYGEMVENFLVLLSSSLFSYANKLFFSESGTNSLFASSDHTAIAKQVWWIIKTTHTYLIDGALHPVLGAGEEYIQTGTTVMVSTITVSDHQAVRIPNGTASKYYKEIQAMSIFVDIFAQNSNTLHLGKSDMMDLCRTSFKFCINTPELALKLPASISTMLIDLSCGEIEAIELLNSIFSQFEKLDIEISRAFTMLTLFVKNQISLCFFDEEYDARVCGSTSEPDQTYKRGLLEMLKRIHPLVINLRSVYPAKYIESELIDVIFRTFLVHVVSISITDTSLYVFLNTLAHCIQFCRNNYSSAANQILVYLILGCEKSKPVVPTVTRPSLADITNQMDLLSSTVKKSALRQRFGSSLTFMDASLKSPDNSNQMSPNHKHNTSVAPGRNITASTLTPTQPQNTTRLEAKTVHSSASTILSIEPSFAALEDSLQVMEMPSTFLKDEKTPEMKVPSKAQTPSISSAKLIPKPPEPKYNVKVTSDAYNYIPIWKYSGFILHQMEALTNKDQPLDNFIYAINKADNTLISILNLMADTEHYHYQMYLPNLLKYLTSLDHTYFSSPGHLSNAYKLVMACLHILQSLLDIGFAMTISELERSVETMISPVNTINCGVLQGYSSPLPLLRKNTRCYMKTIEDIRELTANTSADMAKMDIYVEIGRKSISNTIRRSHLSIIFPPDMSIHVSGLFSGNNFINSNSNVSLPALSTGYNSTKISSPVPQQVRDRNPMLFAQEQSHSFLLDGTGTLRAEDLPNSVANSKEYHFQFVYMHSPLLHFTLEAYSHLIRISNYVLSLSTDALEDTLIRREVRNQKPSEILLWIPLQRIEDIDPWQKYRYNIPLPLTLFRLRSFAVSFRMRQPSIEQSNEKKKTSKKRKAEVFLKALPANRFTQSAIERSITNTHNNLDNFQSSNISIADMLNELGDDDLLEKVPFSGGKASLQSDVLGPLLGMIRTGTGVLENLVLLDSTYADFRYNIPCGDLLMENWPFPIGKISCHFTLQADGKTNEVDHPLYINASHTWDYLYSLTKHIVLRIEKDISFKRTLNFGNFVLLSQTKGDEVAVQEALEHITERNSRILCYLLGRKAQ